MKKAMLFISALLLAFGANAATFDFASYADTDADADGHFEWGYKSFSVTESTIGLTVTAKVQDGLGGWDNAFAYLDEGNAGLGVCQTLDSGNQCNPGSDDNVTQGEQVILSFDQMVSLDEVVFRDGQHFQKFTGDFLLSIDGMAWMTHALVATFTGPLKGTTFAFLNLNNSSATSEQFYLETINVSAVPVPAALFLFAPALLGFFGLRRKAKLAA